MTFSFALRDTLFGRLDCGCTVQASFITYSLFKLSSLRLLRGGAFVLLWGIAVDRSPDCSLIMAFDMIVTNGRIVSSYIFCIIICCTRIMSCAINHDVFCLDLAG